MADDDRVIARIMVGVPATLEMGEAPCNQGGTVWAVGDRQPCEIKPILDELHAQFALFLAKDVNAVMRRLGKGVVAR